MERSVLPERKRDSSIPVPICESLLAGDLRYAGVSVLDKERCRAYEKAMFHKQSRNFLIKLLVRTPDMISLLIFGSCLALGIACAVMPFERRPDWVAFAFVATFFASGVLLYAGIYLCRKVHIWDEVDFGRFYGEMPPTIRETAMDLELVLTDCRVRVRYMGPDPFLVIRRGREMEYLAVWNAPQFWDF